jgi:hypothetical protein
MALCLFDTGINLLKSCYSCKTPSAGCLTTFYADRHVS